MRGLFICNRPREIPPDARLPATMFAISLPIRKSNDCLILFSRGLDSDGKEARNEAFIFDPDGSRIAGLRQRLLLRLVPSGLLQPVRQSVWRLLRSHLWGSGDDGF